MACLRKTGTVGQVEQAGEVEMIEGMVGKVDSDGMDSQLGLKNSLDWSIEG